MRDHPEYLDPASTGMPACAGPPVEVPAGAILFRRGSSCEQFVLVTSGVVRIQTISPSGREITLYRVGPGEACVMTTACLLGDMAYPAEGVAQTPCRLVLLSRPAFEQRMAESEMFRRFVFGSFGKRLVSLMLLFEEVTFERVDVRLAHYLLQTGQDELHATHQMIAAELGSAREVISRHLKDFERRGWLEMQRGRILLRNRDRLGKLAQRW